MPHFFCILPGSSLHRPELPSSPSGAAAREAGGGGGGGGVGRSAWSAFWKSRVIGAPYFSNETATRVRVSRGQTSYLHCLVGNLGDRQVSSQSSLTFDHRNGLIVLN